MQQTEAARLRDWFNEAENDTFRLRMNDLAVFAREHIRTDDIDPAYPVLRALIRRGELGVAESFWFVALYLAFYNLPSALRAFNDHPIPRSMGDVIEPHLFKLPTGVERRGLRDPLAMQAHLESYRAVVGFDGSSWLSRTSVEVLETPINSKTGYLAFTYPVMSFNKFWAAAQTIRYNGRWAAFKWAELIADVLYYPLAFPDMRLKDCTGPLEGLKWLFFDDDRIADLESQEEAARIVRGELLARGLDLPWEKLETVLCDFNSMRKGGYYVGHDIDLMMEQIERAFQRGTISGALRHELYRARLISFPLEYLGERRGWIGVDKRRKAAYRESSTILVRY